MSRRAAVFGCALRRSSLWNGCLLASILGVAPGCRGAPPEPLDGRVGLAGAPGSGLRSDLVCDNSSEDLWFGQRTGYSECSNGLRHRHARVRCPSLLPRAEPVRVSLLEMQRRYHERHATGRKPYVTPVDVDQCAFDSDCKEHPHGYCGRSPESYDKTACRYGCVADSDCPQEQICRCGDPVGECVRATCTVDAECPDGMVCGESYPEGCQMVHEYVRQFACQTTRDECAEHHHCAERGGWCVLSAGVRVCATEDVAFHAVCVRASGSKTPEE